MGRETTSGIWILKKVCMAFAGPPPPSMPPLIPFEEGERRERGKGLSTQPCDVITYGGHFFWMLLASSTLLSPPHRPVAQPGGLPERRAHAHFWPPNIITLVRAASHHRLPRQVAGYLCVGSRCSHSSPRRLPECMHINRTGRYQGHETK